MKKRHILFYNLVNNSYLYIKIKKYIFILSNIISINIIIKIYEYYGKEIFL